MREEGGYASWAETVARETGVAFVPLNEIVARRYDVFGEDAVNSFFGDAHTHTNRVGAELNAESVVAGLKALRENPLAPFFNARAAQVAAFLP